MTSYSFYLLIKCNYKWQSDIKLQLHILNTNNLKFDTTDGIKQHYKFKITTKPQKRSYKGNVVYDTMDG